MCHFRLWRSTRIRTGELCLALRRAKAGQKEGPKAVGDRSPVLRPTTYGGRPAAWTRPGLCCQQWRFLRHGKYQSSSVHLAVASFDHQVKTYLLLCMPSKSRDDAKPLLDWIHLVGIDRQE